MKHLALSLLSVVFLCASMTFAQGKAFEAHVDSVVKAVLLNVEKLKAVNPEVKPMAFWDFDGTILKGDVTEGLSEKGKVRYKGLMEESILAGLSPIYQGKSAYKKAVKDYEYLCKIGKWLGYPFAAQIFEGTPAAALDSLAVTKFRDVYRLWYFTASVEILKRLEAAGVENYIISASAEVFVRNAAESLGLPRERFLGIHVQIRDGIMTPDLITPVSYGEGKVSYLKNTVNARKGGVAVAAFGNSYGTDGPFLKYVVEQQLPGGAKGYALMINGGTAPREYENLFHCVTQEMH